MSSVTRLNEKNLLDKKFNMRQNHHKFASMIMEEVNIRDYTQEDFIDVYITVFKNWIKENYGDSELKYPFSYLKKKYEEKFYETYNLGRERFASEYSTMSKAGKKFVEMALHAYEEVPSTDYSWFDKPLNQKLWKSVENYFTFPPYMNVDVIETRPRNLQLNIDINFEDYIRSEEKNPYLTSFSLISKIQQYMSKYGGVKFGNPLHGDLRLYEGRYNYIGEEEWIKNEFKKIKEVAKKEVNSHLYRGLKYELKDGTPRITVLFNRGSSWSNRSSVAEQVEKIIRDMGYSRNLSITY